MIDIDKLLQIWGSKEVKIPKEVEERIEYILKNLKKFKS